VETARESDDGGTTGRHVRNFDGVFDSIVLAGPFYQRDRVKALGQLEIALEGRNMEPGAREFPCLAGNSRHDLGIAVPGVVDRDACSEIDLATTINIPQLSVFRAFREDRLGADAAQWRLADEYANLQTGTPLTSI
jgi:hypothetical protein